MGASASSPSKMTSRSQFYWPATTHERPAPEASSDPGSPPLPIRDPGRPPPPIPSDRGSSTCPSCHELGGVHLETSDRLVLEVHDDAWEFGYVLVLKRRGGTIHLNDLAEAHGPFSMRAIFGVYEELKARSHCVNTPGRIVSFFVLTTADFGSDVFAQCLLNVNDQGVAFLGRHASPGSPVRCFSFRYFPDDWQETMGADRRKIEEFRHKLIFAVGLPEAAPGGCRLTLECDNDYEEVFFGEDDCLEVLATQTEYDDVFAEDETCEIDDVESGTRSCDETCDECERTRNGCDACDEATHCDQCAQVTNPYDPCDEPENAYDEAENPYDPCDEAENPYHKCDEAENPYHKCDEAEIPCHKCAEIENVYDKCDEAENPYDECDEAENPCDKCDGTQKCDEAEIRYHKCDELENAYDKCDEAENPYHKCDELENAYDKGDEAENPYAECDERWNAYDRRDEIPGTGHRKSGSRTKRSGGELERYTVVKPLVAVPAKLQRRLGFETATKLWDKVDAASSRHVLLSLFETKTSGLFRDDPSSALNSPDFFGDVGSFVERLFGDDRSCVVVASDAAPLTCLKIAQALRGRRAIVDPRSLLDYGDWVDATLATGADLALVVFWHGDDRAAAEGYLRGLEVMATTPRQKIVAVCQRGDEPRATGWRTIADDFDMVDVSLATRERLFRTKLGFQGRTTTVGDFFRGVDDCKIPSGQLLSRVVRFGRHEIAGADLGIGKAERRYARRNFRWSLGCFTKSCLPAIPVSEVLILRGRSPQTATIGIVRRGRLYTAGSGSQDARGAQATLRKNVHRMEWNGSCFVARDVTENHIQDECDMATYGIKVVVVSGSAGSGKTVAVSRMLQDLKARDPEAWIVRVNLADAGDALQALGAKASFGVDDVAELLLRASRPSSALDRAILRAKLPAVVAFVDGFDEVAPAHEATALRALTLLKRSPIRRLWVTTRPQGTRLLEGALACGSFALLPLTERELSELLATYLHDAPARRTRADAVVARVTRGIWMRVAAPLIGSTLLATMLAEVVAVPGAEVDDALTVVSLYERFLETRAGRRLFGPEHAARRTYYTRLALDAILPAEAAALLPRGARKPRRDGLVALLGGRSAFRHRTFAEFFVAAFFAERPCDAAVALRGRFLDGNGDVLRLFLDHMLCGASAPHWAALHGDVRLLAAARRRVRTLDALARTPLHLAAAYPGGGDVVAVLLAWMAAAAVGRPDALGLAPLGYAYATLARTTGAFDMLVAACGEGDERRRAFRATLEAARQRQGGAEAEVLCEIVKSRLPERVDDLRKCLYCAHFRRWHELNFPVNEGASVERLVERMLEFFKAALATERRWGELLRAHNELVARVKGERHRWPTRDFDALFRLSGFFRDEG